jgi:hypothetical protein
MLSWEIWKERKVRVSITTILAKIKSEAANCGTIGVKHRLTWIPGA